MLGNLTQEDVESILKTEVLGRIGCHANGRTYVVPVTYVYDGERVICHSGRGDLIRMMRANPDVCFEVEQIENLANWRSVVAEGQFEELEGSDATSAAELLVDRLMPLMASATATPQSMTPHGMTTDSVIYSILLGKKSGRYESP